MEPVRLDQRLEIRLSAAMLRRLRAVAASRKADVSTLVRYAVGKLLLDLSPDLRAGSE